MRARQAASTSSPTPAWLQSASHRGADARDGDRSNVGGVRPGAAVGLRLQDARPAREAPATRPATGVIEGLSRQGARRVNGPSRAIRNAFAGCPVH